MTAQVLIRYGDSFCVHEREGATNNGAPDRFCLLLILVCRWSATHRLGMSSPCFKSSRLYWKYEIKLPPIASMMAMLFQDTGDPCCGSYNTYTSLRCHSLVGWHSLPRLAAAAWVPGALWRAVRASSPEPAAAPTLVPSAVMQASKNCSAFCSNYVCFRYSRFYVPVPRSTMATSQGAEASPELRVLEFYSGIGGMVAIEAMSRAYPAALCSERERHRCPRFGGI